jgi:hypothetical protein
MQQLAQHTAILALLAGIGFVVVNAVVLVRTASPSKPSWVWPAMLGLAFALFSTIAVIHDGPTGFWPEHSERGLWGNQIWFDLLLAASAAFALALPRLRAQGMNPWLWLALIAMSGSIGLMAMLARLWWLESRRG